MVFMTQNDKMIQNDIGPQKNGSFDPENDTVYVAPLLPIARTGGWIAGFQPFFNGLAGKS